MSLNLSWTPVSVPLSYTVGGDTYPYSHQADNVSRASDSRYVAYTTPINTPLTFVASATFAPGVTALEYRWDFGDGIIGYGPTVTHTYKVAASDTAVTLIVTDSLLNQTSRSKILNLRPADRITISEVISVVVS